MINDLVLWAQQPAHPYRSLWIIGPESDLPHLCAKRLKDQLAASFFSKENHILDPKYFFTTIAFQLATHFPAYEEIIDAKLARYPGPASKALKVQFRELIAEPLHDLSARGELMGSRGTILVGGLDQCTGGDARREILRIIMDETISLPFRWIVFSSPDDAVGRRLPESGSQQFPATFSQTLLENEEGGCTRLGGGSTCVIWLQDGIWVFLFGSVHKAAHWAMLFFLTPR
ncbi:hypothetical protein NP233_g6573 [Leucocoprinus birnbaumii]|uniref:Uncharacterized protein n=1 Tax=Leucocoprinus birnbaumii TaxID=56174 RepID=A0AAD5VQX9_9AGAR|nr:hypothetical protein NP233_g6573 [Leucocoprinus birnbaumii]